MPLFDEYIKDGNPSQKDKSYAWKTAIGLQDVDGLKPSDYLVQTARQNIEGDITKKEWVLDGDTVLYSSFEMIRPTLEYDFREEKNVDYSSLNAAQAVKQICKFISGIWQIHPFCEGNTRATAVFAIKYLRNFGFSIDNEAFAQNSWYFRNALVRANYVNYSKKISSTSLFLERFFDNLLFGANHELRNREMQVSMGQCDTAEIPKCQNGPLNVTLEESALLEFVKVNPKATQEQIAEHIGKSTRTVKRITASLYEKGCLKRENGKRNGIWTVISK